MTRSLFQGTSSRSKKIFVFFVVAAGLMFIAGCGHKHGGSGDDGFALVTGNAFFPPEVAATKTAVANAPFQVVDFEKAASQQVVATGTTDSAGGYSAEITQSKIIAVIVSGAVRVSGLISADSNAAGKELELGKDFNGITDVACQAGATAISDGSVKPDDFDDTRISNLEAGADVVLATTDVNFFDSASVTAAADQVRTITDDGDHPPR